MKRKKILRLVTVLVTIFALGAFLFASPSHVYAQGTGGTSDHVSCTISGDPLTWILCPVFNGISDITRHFLTDFIIPFLKIPPVSTDPTKPIFIAWSNFRIYGDIFLVIAVVIIVIGQAIGGGAIDAYTAKKVLPRILVAAILINLSIYIVAVLVDIANILGNGVTSLMITPFNGTLNFSPSAAQGISVLGLGFLGAILAFGSIAGIIALMITSFGTVFMAGLFAILPFLFAIIGIFFVLIIRQGLILFLVIVSPIAFALYVLPNTERVFRRWWDLMLEALMIYPIVMVIFATAGILSGLVMQANGADNIPGNLQKWIVANPAAALFAFFLQVAPLFIIPFAFRLAGNTLSKAHDLVTKGGAVATKFGQTRGEFAKAQFRDRFQDKQIANYMGLRNAYNDPNRQGRAQHWAIGQLQRRAAGSNPEQMESQLNERKGKEIQALVANGQDNVVRGLMVDVSKGFDQLVDEGMAYINDAGERVYRTIGGGEVSQANVEEAHRVYGHSTAAYQAALTYEIGKAQASGQMSRVVDQAGAVGESLGLTGTQISGASIGAGFSQQQKDVTLKALRRDAVTGQLSIPEGGRDSIFEEQASKSAYQNASMDAHAFDVDRSVARESYDNLLQLDQERAELVRMQDPAFAAERATYEAENRTTVDAAMNANRTQFNRVVNRLRNAQKVADQMEERSYTRAAAPGGGAPAPDLLMPNPADLAGPPIPSGGGGGVMYASPKTKESAELFVKEMNAIRTDLEARYPIGHARQIDLRSPNTRENPRVTPTRYDQ